MRRIISLGIATMLVLVAVGSWAMTSGSQVQPQDSGARTVPVELMMNAKGSQFNNTMRFKVNGTLPPGRRHG
jgi:hypothetical protein